MSRLRCLTQPMQAAQGASVPWSSSRPLPTKESIENIGTNTLFFWCYLGIVVVNFLQLMEYRWTFKVYTIQLLLYIRKKGIYSLPNAPLCIWYIVTALGFMGIYIDSVLETNQPVNLLGDAWNQNRTMWVWDASGFQRVPATKTFAVGVLYRIMWDACLQLQKLDWVWCANVHKSTCRVIWRWWRNIKMSRACGWKTDIG